MGLRHRPTPWRTVAMLAGILIPAAVLGQEPSPIARSAPVVEVPARPAPTLDAPENEPTESIWSKVPPLPPPPRVGYFTIAPGGPGYYSLFNQLRGLERPKPPPAPYPPTGSHPNSFYDADFRFRETQRDRDEINPFLGLKRIHPGDNWMVSLGGEERVRYMDVDGGYTVFTGRVNLYELIRTRVYGDFWYRDRFRLYVEMLDSQIANSDLPPLPNDVNHTDFLNLFTDLKLFEAADHPVTLRAGRQELYFGSQRSISPSDFPNVRRTFQGVRGFWRAPNWDIDAFWVQPVRTDPYRLDPPDHHQNFTGVWATHRPRQGQSIDLYYLYLNNANPVAIGHGGVRGGFNLSTIGARYAGDRDQRWLWDFEGMTQFGGYANQSAIAGSITTGLGYRFARVPTVPQFWLFWDRASGDPHPGIGGTHRTFNQLFPWGHLYFGYLDLVGRQNINDLSLQAVCYPTRWITAQAQLHLFQLVSARDALYNASGAPIRIDPTGRAGTDVGQELDLTTNLHLGAGQDLLIGYSHLFAGSFIARSGPAISPAFFYLQYSVKF